MDMRTPEQITKLVTKFTKPLSLFKKIKQIEKNKIIKKLISTILVKIILRPPIEETKIQIIKKYLTLNDHVLRHLFIKVNSHQELPTKLNNEEK